MRFEDLAVGPAPQLPLETFQHRREDAADRLAPGQALVVATHPLTTYSHDVEHVFRPHSGFWYLTGFAEPGAVLVVEEDASTHLFLRDRKPAAEVWTGRRLGVARAADTLGVDAAYDIQDLPATLDGLLQGKEVLADADHVPAVAQAVANAVPDIGDARPLLAEMRIRKSADEVDLLARAGAVGSQAMHEAMAEVRPGRHEYEIEAGLLRHYRAAGSTGPGYPPIVGSGANAAILHYIENRAPIREGDLVLIDAGCEWGYYNSDITRTVPASGEFTAVQRELYGAVHAAQTAAIREVRPGNRFHDPHKAAVEVLVDALVDLGYLEGDKDALIADGAQKDYFMHGTSHLLGLDVHDVGAYKDGEGGSRRLEPGMCLTVEPGLYFNPDFAACPEEAVGIGIRIEDDLVVTEDGHRNLIDVPKDPDSVLESWQDGRR